MKEEGNTPKWQSYALEDAKVHAAALGRISDVLDMDDAGETELAKWFATEGFQICVADKVPLGFLKEQVSYLSIVLKEAGYERHDDESAVDAAIRVIEGKDVESDEPKPADWKIITVIGGKLVEIIPPATATKAEIDDWRRVDKHAEIRTLLLPAGWRVRRINKFGKHGHRRRGRYHDHCKHELADG
jgi:hypothetical protein